MIIQDMIIIAGFLLVFTTPIMTISYLIKRVERVKIIEDIEFADRLADALACEGDAWVHGDIRIVLNEVSS
jgi:uncharacterized membrane protein YkgB